MKHYLIVVGIIIISIIVVISFTSPLIYCLTFPKAAHDPKSGLIKDRKTYLQKIYHNVSFSPCEPIGNCARTNICAHCRHYATKTECTTQYYSPLVVRVALTLGGASFSASDLDVGSAGRAALVTVIAARLTVPEQFVVVESVSTTAAGEVSVAVTADLAHTSLPPVSVAAATAFADDALDNPRALQAELSAKVALGGVTHAAAAAATGQCKWVGGPLPLSLCDTIQDKNLDWLWNTAPSSMLDKIPIAQNLSFVWPPPKGSRYRLTAFPYPDTGDSSFWVVRFAKGMSSLLDNTAGQVTFPGWQISIYNPLEPNYNSWQAFLTKGINNKGISSRSVYVEVTHACYAPPNYTYPTCDDGGYWLYGTVGSGVFWKTNGTKGSQKTGQYLVCNNKIDAIFKLWNYAQSSSDEGNNAQKAIRVLLGIAKLDPTKASEMKAEDYIMARLKGSGGGLNLMEALRKIIRASHEGKQIPSLTAWRSMEPSKAKTSWATWIAISITLVAILLALGGMCIYTIYLAIKDRKVKKWWVSTLLAIGTILGTVLLGYLFTILEWDVISENMFVGFGYITLDMALKKSGLDLDSFIFATAGLDKNYKNLSKGKYNAIANGFAQTQMFDFDLSYLTSMLSLDSVIMHTQPNKSGSWAVEILDVRNTPAEGKTDLKELIFSLGLCGQPIDAKNQKMPALLQGPLYSTPGAYFGYQPSAKCNCSDANVAKQYAHGKGTLKKCVYCNDSLSETVC